MPTYFRDQFHSPLSRDEAKALVEELLGVMEAAVPEDDEEAELDDESFDVLENLEIEVPKEPPPNAAQAKARAAATGYTPSSFVFEPAAMALLPGCRSSIAIRYTGRLGEMEAFIGVLKRLVARTGANTVVEAADSTKFLTVATYASDHGALWTETPAAQSKAERDEEERAEREAAKPKVKPREAKPGEAEALELHEKLTKILEGKDPVLRTSLRKALERTTEVVRSYAAALLELGPKPDAALAKAIAKKPDETMDARVALEDILFELDDD